MELLWRLSVAGVVIVGPTVLFLGLWHGLMRLRNGELVRRVCARMDETPSGLAVGAPALKRRAKIQVQDRQAERFAPDRRAKGRSSSRRASVPTSPAVTGLLQCARCGHENVVDYDYCRECQAALGEN